MPSDKILQLTVYPEGFNLDEINIKLKRTYLQNEEFKIVETPSSKKEPYYLFDVQIEKKDQNNSYSMADNYNLCIHQGKNLLSSWSM